MTVSPTDILFRPFQLGSLEMENRIVMAPMTRTFAIDGIVNEGHAAYYRRRAEGGVGLILSEGTVIDRPASRNEPDIPFFNGEAALAGWQGVIDAVHKAGGKMGPQIWHTGSTQGRSGWMPGVPVESPSGLLAPATPRGEAMSDEGIAAVRVAVGPGYPIILRLSQWKQQDFAARLASTPDEMEDWLQPLVDAGADILHCSQRRFWEPEFPEIDGVDGLNFAGWAKKLTGAATISVGSVGLAGDFIKAFGGEGSASAGIERLIERMDRDEIDLIAVGRALISDPNWVLKISTGSASELIGFNASALATLV